MKLRTRLITAFITVSVLPILLTGVVIFGMSRYQISVIEKNYGITGTTYKSFSNSVQVFNSLTEESYHKISKVAIEKPELLEDVTYLEDVNKALQKKNSYLIMRKEDKIIYIGGETDKAEALLDQLPDYGEPDTTSENGVYYGEVQALVKHIDFKFGDTKSGSAFIVTDVSSVMPEVKQLISDAAIAIILILVATAALLIFWIYKGVTGPLSKMQEAAKNIKEGNLDFQLEASADDELGQLCSDFEDMRQRLKTNAEEKLTYDRENKELIRHRMFMTKLKDGCEEEYKRRHDGLIAQRGDTVDPGPDSNFSIWSAGGYIFGYDEIDTTMEVEETVEAREQTVEWEMRQLGIMDWITNDVDWMTGDVHADVKRLAWHN